MRISDWSADVCSSDLESNTTRRMFDRAVPASSMKGHLGHTLGACGAIESWWTIEMLNRGWFAPTLNLKTPDPRCGELDSVTGNGRDIQTEHRSEERRVGKECVSTFRSRGSPEH